MAGMTFEVWPTRGVHMLCYISACVFVWLFYFILFYFIYLFFLTGGMLVLCKVKTSAARPAENRPGKRFRRSRTRHPVEALRRLRDFRGARYFVC